MNHILHGWFGMDLWYVSVDFNNAPMYVSGAAGRYAGNQPARQEDIDMVTGDISVGSLSDQDHAASALHSTGKQIGSAAGEHVDQ